MSSAQPASTWRGIFRDLPREHGFEPLRVEGRVPDSLRGTLYRCGPARFGIGGEPYLHWFDADGAVTAVRFGSPGVVRASGAPPAPQSAPEARTTPGSTPDVEGAVRVLDTRWLRKERKANRQLYRSYAQLGRGWRRWLTLPKNPANISVIPWDGQLLALWEAGLPIAVDRDTLETRGETTLGGQIGPTFSAHPHRVNNTLFNFGIHYGPKFSLDLYADAKRIGNVPLPRPTLIHDFIPTAKHLIFFCPPIRLRLARLLAGIAPFDDNLAWEPSHGTEIVVVPLADPTKPIRFTVDPFFQWHFVNAWEERDGIIKVDYIPYDDFETNRWFGRAPYDPPTLPPASRYARATLDLAARRMHTETLSTAFCEFPAFDAQRDATWFLCFDDGLPPSLCRFDPSTRAHRNVPLGEHAVPSEPCVAGDFVLSLVYDGARDASYVAVIDAARPEDGPVARIWFDHAIPFPFHGAWEAM
ncbi:MAG TPA: carotenoid oxygenase family protein [Thermoanaerobaculia bacterium]|nr:carotenoid oxygenase family protein [Thermoanaerobaculia bacterium]